MLYQLFAFYTIDKQEKLSLWEYLKWTVMIFQNLAVLEVWNECLWVGSNAYNVRLCPLDLPRRDRNGPQ